MNIGPGIYNTSSRISRRSVVRAVPSVLGAAIFAPLIRRGLESRHRNVLEKPENIDPAYLGAVAILFARCTGGSDTIDFPVSYLQRCLRLGHRRALSIVAEMEKQGIVSRLVAVHRWRIHAMVDN